MNHTSRIQADVAAWLECNFGPDRSTVDQALVLAEECGEVCRAVVKREQGVRGTHSEWTSEIRKESADVVITLLSLAHTEGFDLFSAVADRWEQIRTRDHVADPMQRKVSG